MQAIQKIHHISAIVGHPQETITFYRDVLGLNLVKQTINFDDPNVYHLYFADEDANPGTVMTFFNWVNAHEGRVGSGQVGRIAFRIPLGTLSYWKEHLSQHLVSVTETNLFNRPTLEFTDYHNLDLALVEGDETKADNSIIGFHGSVLLSSRPEATTETLVEDMKLEQLSNNDDMIHLETVGPERHHIVLPSVPMPMGRWGVGTVHHIAWSIPDDEAHVAWHDDLYKKEYGVTELKERNYFKAFYMKEKGDVIFEFATDGPGFFIDETKEEAGTRLMLPPWYESKRQAIEANLPALDL